RASSTTAPVARTADTTYSKGVLTLARRESGARNSGEFRRTVITARRSPLVVTKVVAARSTRGCGGVSATDRAANFVAMKTAGGGGVGGRDVEHFLAAALPPAALEAMAQHHLLAIVMEAGIEAESSTEPRVGDGPASEAPRHLGDVLLCVPAIHAQRVELEKL